MLEISLYSKRVQALNGKPRAGFGNHISLDATGRQMKWGGMSGDAKKPGVKLGKNSSFAGDMH